MIENKKVANIALSGQWLWAACFVSFASLTTLRKPPKATAASAFPLGAKTKKNI